jgi:hypothetical protein
MNSLPSQMLKRCIRHRHLRPPHSIRNSPVLPGNHLGQVGNVQHLPEIDPAHDDAHLRQIFQYYSLNPDEMEKEIHRYAATLLAQGQAKQAWQVLLMQA